MKNQLADKRTKYPEFMKIVDLISEQNPLQCKRIQAFIMTQDEDYWTFAEDLSAILNRALINDKTRRIEAALAYNNLCMEMLREQIKFRKTGVYPTDDADTARKNIYDQPDAMYKYMVGLLISQMLWPNHYRLFRFFQDILTKAMPASYLEVGAGHGMFTLEALRHFPKLDVVVCDISKASIEISRQMLLSFSADLSRVQFIHADFFESSFDGQRFDFITLGEVLEHVKDVAGFMRRVHNFLLPAGTVYVSTCANCPAVDHVHHFHSVREIRKILLDSNFLIADEIALPAEDIPMHLWEKELVTVNYGAKLSSGKTEEVKIL